MHLASCLRSWEKNAEGLEEGQRQLAVDAASTRVWSLSSGSPEVPRKMRTSTLTQTSIPYIGALVCLKRGLSKGASLPVPAAWSQFLRSGQPSILHPSKAKCRATGLQGADFNQPKITTKTDREPGNRPKQIPIQNGTKGPGNGFRACPKYVTKEHVCCNGSLYFRKGTMPPHPTWNWCFFSVPHSGNT